MTQTIEQAAAVLQNVNAAEKDRVKAAHVLGKSGSENAAELLVMALDDDDYGVHWAASEGLAQLGDAALPALLKALVKPDCSSRVLEGAKHTFHTSTSQNVLTETKEILRTIHGSTLDYPTMKAASDLMVKLSIT
ncbi:MAG: HEAT repeat domain-containing protein [Anaerolineales bacterium]|nr:HEAT repeat domain-containing protein [Anaerolineales bacterium]